MNLTKGAAATAAAFFFVAGLAAAPDVKVITKTEVQTIKVPKLVIVRDDERVVEKVQAPLPEACTAMLDLIERIREQDKVVDQATGKMTELLSDAHRVFAVGSAPELVPVTEAMTAARQTAANGATTKAELLIDLDDVTSECRKGTTE